MATLTATELTDLRKRLRVTAVLSGTKPQINAAIQAIEDAVQSVSNVGAKTLKTYIGQAVETAAAGVFSANDKDTLFVVWSRFNAARGGVI